MLPRKVNLEMVKGDTFAFPLKIQTIEENDFILLDSVNFVGFTNYGGNEIFRKGLYNGIDKPSAEAIEAKGIYHPHIFGFQSGHYLVCYEFLLMDPVQGPLRPAVNTYDTYKIVNDCPIPDFPSSFIVLNEDVLVSYSADTYFKWSGDDYSDDIEDPHESVFYITDPPYGNTVTYLIKVYPEDTKNVEPGAYYYEFRIGVNGDVFTLMYGSFIIRPEVTKE